jgi:hypothetical protein
MKPVTVSAVIRNFSSAAISNFPLLIVLTVVRSSSKSVASIAAAGTATITLL